MPFRCHPAASPPPRSLILRGRRSPGLGSRACPLCRGSAAGGGAVPGPAAPGVRVGRGDRRSCTRREDTETPAAHADPAPPRRPETRSPGGSAEATEVAARRSLPPGPGPALGRLRSSGSAPRSPGQLHPSGRAGRRGSVPGSPAKLGVHTRPGHLPPRPPRVGATGEGEGEGEAWGRCPLLPP